MTLYHGSKDIVEYPEIRKARFNKDFYFGFYCTNIEKQAERWATRYGEKGYINRYEYTENTELKILRFEKMTEEWQKNGWTLLFPVEVDKHISMILWKDRWQMIRSTITCKTIWMVRSQDLLSGNW